ncbi:MAG TPA: outer membrane beta-barrel protein [Thermoanaerobaculia bacterium]|jgi:opacity protein-like surface antigen|nr:outer membrane beta-barrel protein [Thermoanaerobaculia bacterium]
MKLRVSLLVLSAILAAAVASAQVREGTVEISPFAGYLFGGEFARGTTSVFDFRVDVDDDATYGLRVGYNITENFEIEAQGSRTETRFVTDDDELFGNGGDDLGDLTIDYWMGYMTFNFGHRRAVPYVTVGAGVARLDPDIPSTNASRDTRFTGSLGVGVKTFVNPHFGFRFDGRGYATSLGNNDRHDRFSCDDGDFFDSCDNDRDWLTNGELSVGLLFAF